MDAKKALWIWVVESSAHSRSVKLRSLTTAVTSCNLDIHNCTDESKGLSPSLMMYGTVMILPLSLSLGVEGSKGREGLVEPHSREVWNIYTRSVFGLTVVWKG